MELLEVLFSSNKTEEQIPYPGQVVITPTSERWNDFGYKIRCNFKVCINKELDPMEGSLLLGFLFVDDQEKNTVFYNEKDSIDDIIQRSSSSTVSAGHLPRFFTLLPDLQSYRTLHEAYGRNYLELFLRSVNDLSYYKNTNEEWFKLAIETEVFTHGFMRNSEPFFAFHNADSILIGEELVDEVGISNNLNLSFKLEGVNEPHELSFLFSHDSIVPKRICVIIGKNGVGKSESLKAFCRGALRYTDKGLSLVDGQGSRPKINRMIAIATPGETSNTFPAERRATQKLYYRRLTLTRKGTQNIGDCLVQLARSEDEIGGFTRKELFLEALSQAGMNTKEICVQIKGGNFLSVRKFLYGSGEKNTLNWWAGIEQKADPRVKKGDGFFPLSSGQLTFLKFALLSCLYIENGTFVLMDEPETHMHPNMIVDFIGLLDFLLEKTGSQAIIATHSAYFVREVPTTQVLVLSNSDNKLVVDKPRLPTFGATVDSISQFVFQENTEIRLSEKLYHKVKGRNFSDVEDELSNEISLSALMRLKRMMEG